MLCITRKIGELIKLSGGITVTVLDVKGKQVRLGLDAPEEVIIVRGELGGTPGEPKSQVIHEAAKALGVPVTIINASKED